MSMEPTEKKHLQTGKLEGPGANRLGSQIYIWEAHFLFRTGGTGRLGKKGSIVQRQDTPLHLGTDGRYEEAA